MMRRALRGIVPTEVLERRRKGFRGKGLLATLSNNEGRLADLLKCSKAAEVGLIDPINLTETVVHAIHENGQRWTHAVTRLVLYELWQASSFENDLTAAKSLNTWRFVA